jgi:hypothetical protein
MTIIRAAFEDGEEMPGTLACLFRSIGNNIVNAAARILRTGSMAE